MAMIENGEYLIVLEEGSDQRALARLEHYELAGAAWMAAKIEFPKENLQFRKQAQIIQRHDGKPKPKPPPEAPDPDLLDWDVNIVRNSKNDFKGTVMAVDHETAIAVAIEQFHLKDWQIKRLLVTVRTRPVYR
jgi:hypothetical protein